MPTSDNITLPIVSEIVKIVSPESVLDIGVGTGKFGFIFREECEWKEPYRTGFSNIRMGHWRTKLDGIEVCPDYITPIHKYLYDELYIGLAQDVLPAVQSYDLIHMGDVIEHFSKPDGMNVLEVLYNKAKLGILIVTPVGKYPQEGTTENPYQEHKSVWSPRDLVKFPWRLSLKVRGRQWIMFISKSKELLCTLRQERRRRVLRGYLRRHLWYKMLLRNVKGLVRTIHS